VPNHSNKDQDGFAGPRNHGDFTVGVYGAPSSGTTNDQPAISSALQAAVDWCSNVGPATLYFHGGSNYYLYTNGLTVPAVSNLTLASDRAAIPATLSVTNTNFPSPMLLFSGPASGIVLSNLVITNSHGWYTTNTSTVDSTAIEFNGLANQAMSNITVTGCTISGWAIGLFFTGGWNCSIYNNVFLFPMGHDGGTVSGSGWANVGIALAYPPGSTFWNHNFSVYSNYFNGLSATSTTNGLVSPYAGDGLLNADAEGVSCYSNLVYNNSVEGILVLSPASNAVSPCYISNNVVSKDISLAGGWGIVCNVSGSQVHNNNITNSGYGFSIYPYYDASIPATNISFYSNTNTLASGALGYGLGITVQEAVGCLFSNNNFTLNLSNVVTTTNIAFPALFNAGIAVIGGTTNDYFFGNTFTVTPTNSVTNGSGYYGISVNEMFLNTNVSGNIDNFTNNTFIPWGLGVGVFATNYPFGATSPNTESNNAVETNIVAQNFPP
jgi:hypothetical protein